MDQAPVDNKPKGGSRGGRPQTEVGQDEQLALMCTRAERTVIELKAAQAGLTISGFLRFLALHTAGMKYLFQWIVYHF